jgi:hypothetical protein
MVQRWWRKNNPLGDGRRMSRAKVGHFAGRYDNHSAFGFVSSDRTSAASGSQEQVQLLFGKHADAGTVKPYTSEVSSAGATVVKS